jgi:hypothetical protein
MGRSCGVLKSIDKDFAKTALCAQLPLMACAANGSSPPVVSNAAQFMSVIVGLRDGIGQLF